MEVSEFSCLRTPYGKDESLLRRGSLVEPLEEMISTQFEIKKKKKKKHRQLHVQVGLSP